MHLGYKVYLIILVYFKASTHLWSLTPLHLMVQHLLREMVAFSIGEVRPYGLSKSNLKNDVSVFYMLSVSKIPQVILVIYGAN